MSALNTEYIEAVRLCRASEQRPNNQRNQAYFNSTIDQGIFYVLALESNGTSQPIRRF